MYTELRSETKAALQGLSRLKGRQMCHSCSPRWRRALVLEAIESQTLLNERLGVDVQS